MTDYMEPTLFDVDPVPAPAPHVCLAVGRCSCGRFASQPMLRGNDRATSRKAAQRIADPKRLSALQRKVLDNLNHALIHGTDGGLTDWDHEDIIQSTAGKRRLELLRAGLVKDSGYEAKNPNGSDVTVWQITEAGRKVWRKLLDKDLAAYEASQS